VRVAVAIDGQQIRTVGCAKASARALNDRQSLF
jgi:hypothetical protein